MIPLTFGMKLQPYRLPGATIKYVSAPPSWSEHYTPADTQPKAPDGMVQVTSRDQLVVGRRYRRYYKPAGKNPQTTPPAQWAQDTRVFTFLGQDKGFQADDSPVLYTSLFDAGVEPHQGKTGTAWNWCYLVEDPQETEMKYLLKPVVYGDESQCRGPETEPAVQERKMEKYRFDHEELFALLAPAIRLLKEAEQTTEANTSKAQPPLVDRGVQDLIVDDYFSRACGDWASSGNWYNERTPVKDVGLYQHPGLAVVVQLKLLGLAWKTLWAVLWQQVQPKTDLYLDRFLMVARYLFDNPDLLLQVAAQYPDVWTNLVDHLEPRNVDDQWKLYAALRDIGLRRKCYQESKNDFTITRKPPFVPTRMSDMPSEKSKGLFFDCNCGDYITYPGHEPKPVVSVDPTTGEKKHGYSFDGDDQLISPGLDVPRFTADKYWSCTVPFEVSDKAAEAIKDGTHPLVPSPGQHFISLGYPVQYEQKGRITVYAQELTPAEEQALEKQYGPFVKTPYTGSIKVGGTTNTLAYSGKKNKNTALGKELLARTTTKNPLDDLVQGQRNLEAKQEELARTGSVTFDSALGDSVPPWLFNKPKPSPQNEIEQLKHRAFMCGIDTTDSTEPRYIGELRAKLLAYLQGQGILDGALEIGKGTLNTAVEPCVKWGASFAHAITVTEVAELYAAAQISNEAADAKVAEIKNRRK